MFAQERMRLMVVFLLLVGQAFAFTLPRKVDEPFGGLLQTLVQHHLEYHIILKLNTNQKPSNLHINNKMPWTIFITDLPIQQSKAGFDDPYTFSRFNRMMRHRYISLLHVKGFLIS